MKNILFTYQGKTFQGLLILSTEEYPHYYWFYPDDRQLAREVDECLSFKVEPGSPLALTEPCPPGLEDLAEAIQTAIKPYLVGTDHAAPES